ncbi:hypothetical protein Btru_035442 [Bulinus truncatus]|nr:hypothetical protein Btru_035442 [Bulinus truncatus]
MNVLCTVLAAALVTATLSSATDPCPITSVGSSYDFVCHGSTQTPGRFVMWDEVDETGRLIEISRCYFKSPCITQDTSRYRVTNRPQGTEFESTLTINNVSVSDAGKVIKCRAMETSDKVINIFKMCQLSVFNLERAPSCRATVVLPDSVLMTCDFSKVHPKVTCLLGYQSDQFIHEAYIEYDETPLNVEYPVYYNITCKGLLKMRDAAQKKYFVKVLPDFERDIAVEELEKHSLALEATLTTSLVINRPRYVNLCPPDGDVTVTVNCSVVVEVSDPTFHFSVNGVRISPWSSAMKNLAGNMRGIVQVYNLTISRSSKDVRLKCQVGDVLTDTAEISVNIPPWGPPTFHNQSLPLGFSVSVARNDTLFAECSVVGGRPSVSEISVTCFSSNGKRTSHWLNASDIVYFLVLGSGQPATSFCECRASHASGCYDGTAKLEIVDSITRGPADSVNVYTLLYYIAAAFAALIVVPIVVAMCVFVCRHWDRLYYSYYGTHRKPDSPYEYIDHVTYPRPNARHSRKISTQSDSSMSNASDYVARYREHIELHQLPDTIIDDEEAPPNGRNVYMSHTPTQAPPLCGRSGATTSSRGRLTPSESNSDYESSIPPLPKRHHSSASEASMPPPPPPIPAKPQFKYDGSSVNSITTNNNNNYRHSDEEESVYITPSTPPHSSMERLPMIDRKKRLEEEAQEEKRKEEEEYLLKLLARSAEFSSDEDLP